MRYNRSSLSLRHLRAGGLARFDPSIDIALTPRDGASTEPHGRGKFTETDPFVQAGFLDPNGVENSRKAQKFCSHVIANV